MSVLCALLTACAGAQPVPTISIEPPTSPDDDWSPYLTAVTALEVGTDVTARATSVAESTNCRPLDAQLIVCATEDDLETWAERHHSREPDESTVVSLLDPPDPVEIRDGLEVYDEVLHSVMRTTFGYLDLWEHTPAINPAETAYYEANPEVWASVVAFRSASPGSERADALEEALERHRGDRQAMRHLVLRDGVFYFEDPTAARYAVRHLGLRDLFDEPSIEVWRGAQHYVLERGRSGHYYHTAESMTEYRARLYAFDRVGVTGELEPLASYKLSKLRDSLGLDHLEVGDETDEGRPGEAVFLSGQRFEATLIRRETPGPRLGLIGDWDEVSHAQERSREQAGVIGDITDTVFLMVRENLFFDEPDVEKGQQDGIMRLAFMDAYEDRLLHYKINGVVYSVFDEQWRPRPPQVCIDFITDAVERSTGRWWPPAPAKATGRTPGRVNIRRYMRYRQVRRLVSLAEERPEVADLFSFDRSERVPYGDRNDFFENLWDHREELRIADVIVIYGLRSDNRNHWHSFYIYETDPLYGMPVAVADQAGVARIRSWSSVMATAPRRSIHHRVRWNPSWILSPQGVEAAVDVVQSAVFVVEPPPLEPELEPPPL